MHTVLHATITARTTATVSKILFYMTGMPLVTQHLSCVSQQEKAKLKLLKIKNELRCRWWRGCNNFPSAPNAPSECFKL